MRHFLRFVFLINWKFQLRVSRQRWGRQVALAPVASWINFVLLTFLLFSTLGVRPLKAEVEIKAEFKPATICLGENVHWIVTVEDATIRQTAFRPPVIENFNLVYESGFFNTSFINGVTKRSTVWKFKAVPLKEGKFTIPALQISLQGKTYVIPSVQLTVLPPNTQGSVSTENHSQAVFLELAYRRPKRWFIGQSLPAEVRLYTLSTVRGHLSDLLQKQGDVFSATRLIENPEKSTVQIKDHTFQCLTWKTLLTPLKSGEASLKFSLDLAVEMPSSIGSFFNEDEDPLDLLTQGFGGMFAQKKALQTETPTEKVFIVALPDNRPSNFSEGVGHFTLTEPQVVEKEAVQNEPITFVVSVVGEGNFDRFQEPVLKLDEAIWRSYAPKATFESNDTVGYRGKMRYEFLLVPLRSGRVPLPTVEFAFFDPDKEIYQSIQTESSLSLTVKPPIPEKNRPSFTLDKPDTLAQSPTSDLPHDIVLQLGAWVKTNRPWVTQPLFWHLQGLLALGALVFGLFRHKQFRRSKDEKHLKIREMKRQLKRLTAEIKKAFQRGCGATLYDCSYRAIQLAIALKLNDLKFPEVYELEEVENVLCQQGIHLSNASLEVIKTILYHNNQIKFGGGMPSLPADLNAINVLFKELK